jgi:hypothetical protein
MPVTTAMLTSFKQDMLLAGHCFAATVSRTGTTTTNQPTATSFSSISGIAVGMAVSGGGFPVGTVIASIDNTSQITGSKNSTLGAGSATLTVSGDAFKLALIRASMNGTYNADSTGYGNLQGNADEVTGAGYSVGGVTLTSVAPATSAGFAMASFQNPSWTSASFTFRAAMLYNASARLGVANRGVAVFDFGLDEQVTGGTVTVIMPTMSASTALIRV